MVLIFSIRNYNSDNKLAVIQKVILEMSETYFFVIIIAIITKLDAWSYFKKCNLDDYQQLLKYDFGSSLSNLQRTSTLDFTTVKFS